MAVVATNALEPRWSQLGEHRQVLVNIELNNVCANTPICGSTCYLNLMAAGKTGKALSPELVFAAACEVIEHGWDVRHLVLPGKEVWESATLLMQIAEAYHGAPSHKRPGSLGIVTASASGLRRYGGRLAETPLTWTATAPTWRRR